MWRMKSSSSANGFVLKLANLLSFGLVLVPFCDARPVYTCLNSPPIHSELRDRRKWRIAGSLDQLGLRHLRNDVCHTCIETYECTCVCVDTRLGS